MYKSVLFQGIKMPIFRNRAVFSVAIIFSTSKSIRKKKKPSPAESRRFCVSLTFCWGLLSVKLHPDKLTRKLPHVVVVVGLYRVCNESARGAMPQFIHLSLTFFLTVKQSRLFNPHNKNQQNNFLYSYFLSSASI